MLDTPSEIHPYNDIESIPLETETLIIGTAPPQRFSNPRPPFPGPDAADVDWYYGSKDNLLWRKLLLPGRFADGAKPDVAALQEFVRKRKVWMHDVFQQYRRKNEFPVTASDDALEMVKPADFSQIFRSRPSLHTLIFTGQRAEDEFRRVIENKNTGLIAPYSFNKDGLRNLPFPRRRQISLRLDGNTRLITTYTYHSPSGRNAPWLEVMMSNEMYGGIVRSQA